MKNFITLQESVQEEIRSIGVFLWVVTAIMAFRAVMIDGYYLLDVAILGSMAYFAYTKGSSKAVYFTVGYYILDTMLWFDTLTQAPLAIVIRAAILFWIVKTAFNAYQANRNPDMTVEVA